MHVLEMRWAREIAILGEQEFHRRTSAVAGHQLRRTGPSGFEESLPICFASNFAATSRCIASSTIA
jgi:hypothetical protein